MSRPPRLTHPFLLSLLCSLPLAAQQPLAPPAGGQVQPVLTLDNGQVVLTARRDPVHGLVLVAVGDPAEPRAFRLEPEDLWSLELRDPASGQVLAVAPSLASFFQLGLSALPGGGLQARWERLHVPGMPPGGSVEVALDLALAAGEPVATMTLAVTANSTGWSVYRVRPARVQVLERWPAARGVLAMPQAEGQLLPDPMHNGLLALAQTSGRAFVHPQELSMQWLALYDSGLADGPCLFLGTRDPAGWRKEFLPALVNHPSGPDALRLELALVPEDNLAATTFQQPFPFVLGVLRGDWYDAARFYRQWALQQPWAAQGPMHGDPDFSPRIRDGRMFGTFAPAECCPGGSGTCACDFDDSNFQYWLATVQELESWFGIPELPVHLYGWDHDSFNGNWGDWFPAQPGFTAAAPQVAAAGRPFAPYFNNLLYSQTAPGYGSSWVPGYTGRPISDFSLVDEQGSLIVTQTDYCVGDHDCQQPPALQTVVSNHLDLAGAFARDYTEYMAGQLVGLGARGLYLDVFTAVAEEPAYNSGAGHPVGGGAWYTQGKQDLVRSLRAHARQTLGVPDFYVLSENVQEMYLGLVELAYGHHTWDAADDPVTGAPWNRPAPLWATVYHEFQITGTVGPLHVPAGFPLLSDAAAILGARRFWGALLFTGRAPYAGAILSPSTLAGNVAAHPDYAEFMTMLRNWMAVWKRDEARKWLVFGSRRRDPATTVTRVAFPPGPMLPYSLDQPLVYVSAWGREDLDGAAILLCNWTRAADSASLGVSAGDQTFQYTLRAEDLGLQPRKYRWSEVTAGGVVNLGSQDLSSPVTLTVTVPALTLRLFVLE